MSDDKSKRRERVQGLRDAMSMSLGHELGKLPPQAVDLEEAVLGAIMLEPNTLTEVLNVLSVESFYKEGNARIFEAIVRLAQRSEPVDILTVTHELRRTQQLELVGGPVRIASLTNRVASTANVVSHARIVSQKFIGRELIRISQEILKESYDETEDVFDVLDRAQAKMLEITTDIKSNTMVTLQEAAKSHVDNMGMSISSGRELLGITTGMAKLDYHTGGWISPDLIIVAGRPGMGKTGFAVTLAKNAAMAGMGTLVFTMEMSKEQIASRVMAMTLPYNLSEERRGLEARKALFEKVMGSPTMRQIANMPFYIDDTPALKIFDLRARVRRAVAKQGVQLVIIDYLQLMSGESGKGKSSGNREQEISTISRGLKQIAKENNVPVIALSQLSRQVETRQDKMPILSDLRESGSIEQDADMVIFLQRPEYYGINELHDGTSTQGIGLIKIAKFRNGPVEDPLIMSYRGMTTEWYGYSSDTDTNYVYRAPEPNKDFEKRAPTSFSDLENDEFF